MDEGDVQERDLAARYRAWSLAWKFVYPFVGKILNAISGGYEREAAHEDVRLRVRQRLHH